MSLQQTLVETPENLDLTPRAENALPATTACKNPLPAGLQADAFPIPRPLIRVFVVYEHDLNRDRARFMQEELTRRLGRSFNFAVSWWKLKSLWHPKMLQLAADAVAKADIILFSLLSGGELPQAVTKWIEKRLVNDATHRVSLLALLETGGMIVPRLSPAEIYLSHLASKVGVDCLCYSDSIPLARATRNRRRRPWRKKKVCSTGRLMSAELRE